VVSQLSHPNIVKAFDVEQAHGRHYYAMEYVHGTDLAKLLKLSGPLPVGQAADFTRQAALGLQHAHKRGLVHRDIKPANLMLVDGGQVIKILDLGLARLPAGEQQGPGEGLTQDGSIIGTPDYQAPEQAKNPRSADIRADIYSLGCTFYFLLTGEPPFSGNSVLEKVLNHQRKDAPPITDVRKDVPGELCRVVQKMMAKQPADRYQTPVEVALALASFCQTASSAGK
jgi:serine/threonine protein kinase